jgi:MFS family permease
VFVALALYATGIGSPSDVGLVLAAHVVPLVGFILLGGVWADRLPRQKLIIATDLARFVLHGLLAGLIAAGAVAIWMLVVIEVLYGTAEAFSKPAQTGLLPQTVPEDEIQQAKAAASSMETVAEFAGPALATALVSGSARRGRSRSTPRRSWPPPRSWRGCARAAAASPSSARRSPPSCARAGPRCARAPGCGRRSGASRSRSCSCSRRGRRSGRPRPRRPTARARRSA